MQEDAVGRVDGAFPDAMMAFAEGK